MFNIPLFSMILPSPPKETAEPLNQSHSETITSFESNLRCQTLHTKDLILNKEQFWALFSAKQIGNLITLLHLCFLRIKPYHAFFSFLRCFLSVKQWLKLISVLTEAAMAIGLIGIRFHCHIASLFGLWVIISLGIP